MTSCITDNIATLQSQLGNLLSLAGPNMHLDDLLSEGGNPAVWKTQECACKDPLHRLMVLSDEVMSILNSFPASSRSRHVSTVEHTMTIESIPNDNPVPAKPGDALQTSQTRFIHSPARPTGEPSSISSSPLSSPPSSLPSTPVPTARPRTTGSPAESVQSSGTTSSKTASEGRNRHAAWCQSMNVLLSDTTFHIDPIHDYPETALVKIDQNVLSRWMVLCRQLVNYRALLVHNKSFFDGKVDEFDGIPRSYKSAYLSLPDEFERHCRGLLALLGELESYVETVSNARRLFSKYHAIPQKSPSLNALEHSTFMCLVNKISDAIEDNDDMVRILSEYSGEGWRDAKLTVAGDWTLENQGEVEGDYEEDSEYVSDTPMPDSPTDSEWEE